MVLVIAIAFANGAQAHEGGHRETYRGIEPTGPVKDLVKLSKRAREAIGLQVTEIRQRPLPLEIVTLGKIEAITTRSYVQHALLAGRVIRVSVELGDHVRAGQTMAILDSPEINRLAAETVNSKTRIEADIDKAKSQYAAERKQAAAKLDLANANLARMKTLYEEKIAPKKDLDTAEAEQKVAFSHLENVTRKEQVELAALDTKLRVSIQSLTDRLRQIGVPQNAIQKMLTTNSTILQVPVTSTRSGVVTKIDANPGESINDRDPLFNVLDLEKVWATADVYETDMDRVTLGQKVVVKAAALPHETFEGKLSYIGSEVDPEKRTLPVHVEIRNMNLRLKPDMFVELFIQTEEPTTAIILPKEAIVEKTGHHAVFVEVKEGVYQLNIVEIGRSLGDNMEIVSGLTLGQKIVSRGAFQLDAHLLKAQGNTELFSHPTEEGHSHEHEEGGHEHEHEVSGHSGLNPLVIVFLVLAFVLGSVTSAVLIRATAKTSDISERSTTTSEQKKEHKQQR